MDLILWRHAEAEDGRDDAARVLTPKGAGQAARMAAWLDARLPKDARVLVSPAVRAQQTAEPLQRPRETLSEIAPGASPATILRAAGWAQAREPVVVVAHQPSLGAAAALALTGQAMQWQLDPGSVWWLSVREGVARPIVRAVVSADLL